MEKHTKPVEPVGVIHDSFGILNWIEMKAAVCGSCFGVLTSLSFLCYLKIINENSGTGPEVIVFILGASGLEVNRKKKPPSAANWR